MATFQTYKFHDLTCVVTNIDRRNLHRQVPMRVLVLGLCRTGTDCECLPVDYYVDHGLISLQSY